MKSKRLDEFQRKCRLCGRIGRRFTDIFNSWDTETAIKLSQLIFNCLNLQINEDDGLPKKVCDDCTRKLTTWQSFHTKCLQTQEQLQHDFDIYNKLSPCPDSLNEQPSEDNILNSCDNDVDESSVPTVNLSQDEQKASQPSNNCKSKISRRRSNPTRRRKHPEPKKCNLNEVENKDDEKQVEVIPSTEETEDLKEKDTENVVSNIISEDPDQKPTKVARNKNKTGSKRKRCVVKPAKVITTHQCHLCERTFTHKGKFNYHVALHQSVEHRCETCNKLFKSKFSLRCHAFTHSEKRNFCCHVCGQLFRTASCLCNHVKLHSDVKQYECSLCGKAFHQSNHLDQHLRTHTGERPYHCIECSNRFTTRCQLNRHIEAIHRRVKKHRCDICDKEFLYNNNFRAHMLMHKGQRNIKCDICDKGFITSNGLLRHRRFHTGEKPFKCDVCGKKFSDCSNRKRHMIQHQNPKPKPKQRNRQCQVVPPPPPPLAPTVIIQDAETNEPKTYTSLRTFLESSEVVETLTGGKCGDEEVDETDALINVEYVTLLASNELELTGVQEIIMVPKETKISEYEQLLSNVITLETSDNHINQGNNVNQMDSSSKNTAIDSYSIVDSDSNDLVEVFLTPKNSKTADKSEQENVGSREEIESNNIVEVFLETQNHEPTQEIDSSPVEDRVQVHANGNEESANLIKVFLTPETSSVTNKDVQNESSFFTSSDNFDKESIIRMLNSQGTTVA